MGVFKGFGKIFKEKDRVAAAGRALAEIRASDAYTPLTKAVIDVTVSGVHHRKFRAKFTGSETLFPIEGTAESLYAMADYLEANPQMAEREIAWEQTLGRREKEREEMGLIDKIKEKIADNPIAAMVVTAGLTYGVTKLGQGLIAKSRAAGVSEAKKGFLAKAGNAANTVGEKLKGFFAGAAPDELGMGETPEALARGPSVVRIVAYAGAAVAVVVMGTLAFRML